VTTRVLPPAEWPRLAGTELETLWPHLDREQARVIAVEDEGRIVGCWAVYPLVHVEGVWIAPEYRRRGSVARRLLCMMRRIAHGMGAQAVQTASVDTTVTKLLQRLGAVDLNARHFSLKV
jgi:N-acetylglutamate synthase-like GNAT family acetyltransferase